jgi:hypothetical protein
MNKDESAHKNDDFTKQVVCLTVHHGMNFLHALQPSFTCELLPPSDANALSSENVEAVYIF